MREHKNRDGMGAARRIDGGEAGASSGFGGFAGLLLALSSRDFGAGGERAVDFDSIAFQQSVIRPSQLAENTERRIRKVDAVEIGVECGQMQGVADARTRREAQDLDDDALRLRIDDLDPERCISQLINLSI